MQVLLLKTKKDKKKIGPEHLFNKVYYQDTIVLLVSDGVC